ncbi:MAG: VWA domain-containing protein [Anaerolineae bacterium]|nr:VWA domain-containing protein [Anaerolineae bacterium]
MSVTIERPRRGAPVWVANMSFVRPTYLYLLGLVPLFILLLIWSSWRRRQLLARLGAPALLSRLSQTLDLSRRRLKAALTVLAAALLILALARPSWGTQFLVRAQEGVEVMVTLDVSASMLAEDVKPNRLARAKLVVQELMDRLGGNDLGLVLFSGAAFQQFPLTNDFGTALSFLNAASPSAISRPGTALGEAIRVALESFPEERSTSRVILLLTDGEGHADDPLAAAREAAAQGVVIHTIGLGSAQGEPIPLRDASGDLIGYKRDAQGRTVLSRLDEVTLQRLAAETGGEYVRVDASGAGVDVVVGAIAGLRTGESERQFEVEGVERYEWFAGLALLALAAEALLSERRRGARAVGGGRV